MEIVSRSENRIQLESERYQASVRLTWDSKKKNWLLTAFEKKNSASDNTTDTGETLTGKQNDTATLLNTVSDSKDNNNSITNKTDAINQALQKLNLGSDVIEVISDVSTLPVEESEAREAIEKGRNVKGWFNTSTGKTYIYAPNVDSVQDATETLWHEVIAHKGLRDLLGDKFNDLLDNVWNSMSEQQREKYVSYVSKKPYSEVKDNKKTQSPAIRHSNIQCSSIPSHATIYSINSFILKLIVD